MGMQVAKKKGKKRKFVNDLHRHIADCIILQYTRSPPPGPSPGSPFWNPREWQCRILIEIINIQPLPKRRLPGSITVSYPEKSPSVKNLQEALQVGYNRQIERSKKCPGNCTSSRRFPIQMFSTMFLPGTKKIINQAVSANPRQGKPHGNCQVKRDPACGSCKPGKKRNHNITKIVVRN